MPVGCFVNETYDQVGGMFDLISVKTKCESESWVARNIENFSSGRLHFRGSYDRNLRPKVFTLPTQVMDADLNEDSIGDRFGDVKKDRRHSPIRNEKVQALRKSGWKLGSERLCAESLGGGWNQRAINWEEDHGFVASVTDRNQRFPYGIVCSRHGSTGHYRQENPIEFWKGLRYCRERHQGQDREHDFGTEAKNELSAGPVSIISCFVGSPTVCSSAQSRSAAGWPDGCSATTR